MAPSRAISTIASLCVSLLTTACNADEPCPSLREDTGEAPDPDPDTGDTAPAEDPMALDLEDGSYAFEGTLPGTEDAETSDSCAGDCYRCLTLSDGHAVASFYGDTVETVEFTYLVEATGSYNVELIYLWTAARSQALVGSYASAYLVVERQNGAPVVLELSECIGH